MPTGLEALAEQQGAGAYGTHLGAPILNAQVLDRLGGTFGNVHQDLGLGWGTLEGSPDVIGVRSGAELLGGRRLAPTVGSEGSEQAAQFEGLESIAQRLGIDTSKYMTPRYTTGEGGAQEQIGQDLDQQALWDAIGQDPRLAGKYMVTANRQGWGGVEGLAAGENPEHQYARVMYQREGDRLVPVAAPDTFEYHQQSVLQEALPILGLLTVPWGGIGGLVGKGVEAAGLGNVMSGASTGLTKLLPPSLTPAVEPALRGAISGGVTSAIVGGDIGTGILSGGLGGATSGLVGASDFVRDMSPVARDFTTTMAGNVASQVPFGRVDFQNAFASSALSAGTRAALSGARQALIDDGMDPRTAGRLIAATASLAPNVLLQRDISPQQIISLVSRVAAER